MGQSWPLGAQSCLLLSFWAARNKGIKNNLICKRTNASAVLLITSSVVFLVYKMNLVLTTSLSKGSRLIGLCRIWNQSSVFSTQRFVSLSKSKHFRVSWISVSTNGFNGLSVVGGRGVIIFWLVDTLFNPASTDEEAEDGRAVGPTAKSINAKEGKWIVICTVSKLMCRKTPRITYYLPTNLQLLNKVKHLNPYTKSCHCCRNVLYSRFYCDSFK